MIKSVEKALNILSFVVGAGNVPVPLGMIAQACQLNDSTCAHLVDTLCETAYLEKVSAKQGYIPGPKAYMVSIKRYYRQELMEAAMPVMKELCLIAQENSVTLSVLLRKHLFSVCQVTYMDGTCVYKGLALNNLYHTASGRVLLAYADPGYRDALIRSIGYPPKDVWDIQPGREALEAEFSAIRAAGYASYEHLAFDKAGMAAPVLVDGEAVATLALAMTREHFCGWRVENLKQTLLYEAGRIGKRLEKKKSRDLESML